MRKTENPNSVRVFIGAPISDRTELRFLARVRRHLEASGEEGLILANFQVGLDQRQVDFLIATPRQAVTVEVKGYRHAVSGAENGPWAMRLGTGTRSLGYPHAQALGNRYAVCDRLKLMIGSSVDVRDGVAGMLCLFPEPPAASELPASSRKLAVGGFTAFIELLRRSSSSPISLGQWEALAGVLNLTPWAESLYETENAIIADYVAHCSDLAEVAAGPFILPSIEDEEKSRPLPPVVPLLMQGNQIHVAGPSGVGKTRLVAHLIGEAARATIVPIGIAARDFDGALLPLLRGAVARSTRVRFETLMHAADVTGRIVLLCVDALNECPRGRLPELVAALQTVSLRYGVTVMLTGQLLPDLPTRLAGSVFQLAQPNPELGRELTEAHLGRPLDEAESTLLEIIGSAQDATVLAEAVGQSSNIDGRFALYNAFTLNRLPEGPHRYELHGALGELAATMRKAYSTTIAEAAAARLLGRATGRGMIGTALLAEAEHAALIVPEGGTVRFRHDLIADFFAADQLLRRAENSSDLAGLAIRPINAELQEFVLGGCATTEEASALVDAGLPDSVIDAALYGRCGTIARTLLLDRCHDVIERIEQAYTKLQFSLPAEADGQHLRAALVFAEPFELSPRELKAAFALSTAANTGLFDRLMRLLGALDLHLWNEARRLRNENPNLKRNIPAMVFGGLYGDHFQPEGASLLRHLFNNIVNERISRRSSRVCVDLNAQLDDFENKSPGQLFLLLAMHRGFFDRGLGLPQRTAELVQCVWGLGIYHLNLMLMDLIHFNGRRAPPDQRQEIYDVLMAYLTDNPWINMILMDAISAVGEIPFGLTVENIVEDYEEIAREPLSDETGRRALSAYTCTYDHPASDLFAEAFNDHLSAATKSAVLTRALNDPTADSMSLEFVIRELGRYPSDEATPLLMQFTFTPEQKTHSAQSSVACFAEAIGQLARMGQPLAPISDLSPDRDILAWQQVRSLLYAFNVSPRASQAHIETLWSAFRAAGDGAAMDVLLRLTKDSRVFGGDVSLEFTTLCGEGLRSLCLAALAPDYVPSSMFQRFEAEGELSKRHRKFACSSLSAVGRSTDKERVEKWLEDPQLGGDALRALRAIEAR